MDSVAPIDHPNDVFFVHSEVPPYVFSMARNNGLSAIH